MKIFVIGSGPAVEGQVTARAVHALKEHGHGVVLLEPNPGSQAEADRTYLEPLTAENAAEPALRDAAARALLRVRTCASFAH